MNNYSNNNNATPSIEQVETHVHRPREKPLSDAVQFFWQVNRENTAFSEEIIVPKGIVEIIFNFSPEKIFNARLYNKNFLIPKCFIQGYHYCPVALDLPDSQLLFGVVLHTVTVKHILKVPAGEFARHCIDLTEVDMSFYSLWCQLAEKKTFQEKTSLFSEWLIKRLPCLTKRELTMNDLFSIKTNEPLSVSNVSESLCYSPRHLSRMFNELTGGNTEQTLLYLKYLKAVDFMHYSNLSLTQIAHTCEFSDQSHFNKTFKSFTTLTPNDYRDRKSEIPGHYFENVR